MSLRNFYDYVNRVSAHVVGCPDPVTIMALRDSAIDFCNRTMAWRDYTDWHTIRQNQDSIALMSPKYAEIARVMKVFFYTGEMAILTQEEATSYSNTFPSYYSKEDPTVKQFDDGEPTSCFFLSTNVLHPIPVPDKDYVNAIRAFCAFKPKIDAEGMESDVFDQYYEVIIAGALMRLFIQPNKTWSDGSLSAYWGKMYHYGCNRARANVNLGNAARGMSIDTSRAGIC